MNTRTGLTGPNVLEKRSARPSGRGSRTGGTGRDVRILAATLGRTRDGHSLRLGVHEEVFTRWTPG